jgi:tetratricopeptide (TPR) repeat protein
VPAADPARRPAGADAGVFLGTFALIFLAMGGLFGADLFLAGLERAEQRSEARHAYEEAGALLREGRRDQAVDRLHAAVAAERDNPVYQRALAAALLADGKAAEAQALAADRLQRAPTDAAASLIVARALVQEGKRQEAVSYFHRAIYGQWDANPAGNRVRARFELVDILAAMGDQKELLAELLPLQDEAPADLATRRRMARLFLEAGAPTRAAEIFRDLLHADPRDAGAYAGLGDAELARGNYRSARADFSTASRLAPEDSAIAGRLELVQRVIALDPTQRGLGSDEQYRRSVALLGLTLQAADSCTSARDSAAGLLDSVRVAVSAPAPRRKRQDAFEANLAWAERLWDLRGRACPGRTAPTEESIRLVLDRVAQ